ncbi:MAG: four-carbon acid sugar kinase family protein, partial [Gaiellales bacterium]
MMSGRPLIVLDDDPTGAQAVTGVPMLLDWEPEALEWASQTGAPAIHLLTNTRAFSPGQAYEIVRSGAEAAVVALDRPRLLLRGDSTLRAHLYEEYRAVRDVAFPGREPVLMLVPALPAAGRITVGGVHLLETNGDRMPLHETEYAR